MKLMLKQIRDLADDRYIDRGRAYLAGGQLQLTKVTADQGPPNAPARIFTM